MDKAELRKQALDTRKSIGASQRDEKSIAICRRLELSPVFKDAQNILFYYNQKEEVQTIDLIKKHLSAKKFYLPKLTSESSFIPVVFNSFDELRPGAFGIMEPEAEGGEAKLDLIIVPGVAFDRSGGRLGMGKGYYDRFLAMQEGVTTVALAFSEQVLEEVPKEPYDKNVDMIITENEIIRCLK